MASAIVRRNITHNLKKLPFLSSSLFNSKHLFNVEPSGSVSFHSETVAGGGGAGLPSYMRGAVYWEPNKPLTIEEFHIPRPKAGELLIKTKGNLIMFLFNFYIEMKDNMILILISYLILLFMIITVIGSDCVML